MTHYAGTYNRIVADVSVKIRRRKHLASAAQAIINNQLLAMSIILIVPRRQYFHV